MTSRRIAVAAATTLVALSAPFTARGESSPATFRFLGEPSIGYGACIEEDCGSGLIAVGLTLFKFRPEPAHIIPRAEAFMTYLPDHGVQHSRVGAGGRVSAELPWIETHRWSMGLLLNLSMEARTLPSTRTPGQGEPNAYLKLAAGPRLAVPRGVLFILPQIGVGRAVCPGDDVSKTAAVELTIGLGIDLFPLGFSTRR
ncbi:MULTISPECIES: hypothetical protein [Sorangium]|uniref:hypothetical protein n=1 Tax=Sorangium TaxID=39643 RepID=UPI0005D24D94|nr:hypothetical protein [Sorangium cellulosum]